MNKLNKMIFENASASKKALDLIEEGQKLKKPAIGADMFSEEALENKLQNDATFLVSLGKSLDESSRVEYFETLEIILENTASLYKEIDMKPRTCSHAIDTQELTESVAMSIYSKNLTESINKDFALPLFEGTLFDNYSKEVKMLTEASVASGLSKTIDNELFLKYAIFENELYKNTFHLMIPEVLEEKTNSFIKVQDAEYFEIFDKNALTLKNNIEESCVKLVSLISPKLFEESAGVTGVESFAGISSVLH